MKLHAATSEDHDILRWRHRLVTAETLEHHLNGHRVIEVPTDVVVTPQAVDILKERSVSLLRTNGTAPELTRGSWGYGSDRDYGILKAAIQTIIRNGVVLQSFLACPEDNLCQWAKEVAAWVGAGECRGGCLFCADPGLICCVANKVPGVRAVGVTTVRQAARATLTVGANLLVIEMPGRTFFELRQILQMAADIPRSECPSEVAKVLGELDGHAHH